MWCDARRNGWVIESDQAANYKGRSAIEQLKSFTRALETKSQLKFEKDTNGKSVLQYTSIHGSKFTLKHRELTEALDSQHVVDEQPINHSIFGPGSKHHGLHSIISPKSSLSLVQNSISNTILRIGKQNNAN